MDAVANPLPKPSAATASIPFIDLAAQYQRLKPRIDAAIQDVLDHGQYVLGPAVARFERELTDFVGCADTVTTSSGTDALYLPLLTEGVGPGDAVFVPAFTFTATPEVVRLAGATPVFVDVDPDRLTIDPDALAFAIEQVRSAGRLRPRGLVSVDLFGTPCDYDRLAAIVEQYELLWVSDAAQAFGAEVHGRRVGSIAPITATSFFPAKPLGCYGDGGAIFLASSERSEVMRSVRTHGHGTHKFEVLRVGTNARLDAIQAAILSVKLTVAEEERDRREALASAYDEAFAGFLQVPHRPEGTRSAWANYTIRTDDRDRLEQSLKAAAIPTKVFYPTPMHLQPAYAAFGEGPGSMPVSERLCGEVLSLPMHAYMDDGVRGEIIDAVRVHFGA